MTDAEERELLAALLAKGLSEFAAQREIESQRGRRVAIIQGTGRQVRDEVKRVKGNRNE